MSIDPNQADEGGDPTGASEPVPDPGAGSGTQDQITRASAAWVATGAALVLLTLLIVFILQNQAGVKIRFLGFAGTVPLGVAMMIAAVAGGGLVGIAGLARVIQLRRVVRRSGISRQARQ